MLHVHMFYSLKKKTSWEEKGMKSTETKTEKKKIDFTIQTVTSPAPPCSEYYNLEFMYTF